MRYGKGKPQEIDPAARRGKNQGLKKAAPGAPFGWRLDGTPYRGTTYEVSADGSRFASVSTRDPANTKHYWQPTSAVSKKVALSALETHGSMEKLLGFKSLSPDTRTVVRTIFSEKVGGEDTLAWFEALEEEEGEDVKASTEADAKASHGVAKAAKSIAKSGAAKSAGSGAQSLGDKRVARMRLVDGIKELDAGEEAPRKKSRRGDKSLRLAD